MIEMSSPFPLDEDGFLRRECPLLPEFQDPPGERSVRTFEQKSIGSFMLETQEEEQETGEGDGGGCRFHVPTVDSAPLAASGGHRSRLPTSASWFRTTLPGS